MSYLHEINDAIKVMLFEVIKASEDVANEGVIGKPMKVNPLRVLPDGSKKRVSKADASPPVLVVHSPPRPVNVKYHQN
nr:hypothetical protein [Tanacetum cinerariifolium]